MLRNLGGVLVHVLNFIMMPMGMSVLALGSIMARLLERGGSEGSFQNQRRRQ